MTTTSCYEAVREGVFTLRPRTTPVKRENRKRQARHSRLECAHRSQQMSGHYDLPLRPMAHLASSSVSNTDEWRSALGCIPMTVFVGTRVRFLYIVMPFTIIFIIARGPHRDDPGKQRQNDQGNDRIHRMSFQHRATVCTCGRCRTNERTTLGRPLDR